MDHSLKPEVDDGVREMNRKNIHKMWVNAKKGLPLKDDEKRLVEIMRQHPDLENLWNRLDQVTDQEIAAMKVNPILHITMHLTVENQIVLNQPRETNETVNFLLAKGYNRHQVIHAVANVLIQEINAVIREKRAFNINNLITKYNQLKTKGI